MFTQFDKSRSDTPLRRRLEQTTNSTLDHQTRHHGSVPSLLQSSSSTSLNQRARQRPRPTLRKVQQSLGTKQSTEIRPNNENSGTFRLNTEPCKSNKMLSYDSSSSSSSTSSLCSSDSSSYNSSFEEEIDDEDDDNNESTHINNTLQNDVISSKRIHQPPYKNDLHEEKKNEYLEFRADENTFYDCDSPSRLTGSTQCENSGYSQSPPVDMYSHKSREENVPPNSSLNTNLNGLIISTYPSNVHRNPSKPVHLKREQKKQIQEMNCRVLDHNEEKCSQSEINALNKVKEKNKNTVDDTETNKQNLCKEQKQSKLNDNPETVRSSNVGALKHSETKHNTGNVDAKSEEYIQKLTNLCHIYREEHQAARFMVATLTLEKQDLELKLNEFMEKFLQRQNHYQAVYTENLRLKATQRELQKAISTMRDQLTSEFALTVDKNKLLQKVLDKEKRRSMKLEEEIRLLKAAAGSKSDQN